MLLGLVEQAVALLLRLIGVAQAIQFVVNILNGPADNATPGSSLAVINARTTLIEQDIESPLFGLAHIEATIVSNQTALLTAIANLTNGTTPVSLPPTPPAGYGGASASATASAVWAFPDPNTGQPTVDLLADAGLLAINMSDAQIGLPSIGNPPWYGAGAWTSTTGPMRPDTNLPKIDYTTILATDNTATDWLNREYSSFGTFTALSGYPTFPDGAGALQWVLWLDQAHFDALKALLFPVETFAAPVWPGIANVTLGTSQALADGLLIPGPLDGVIIAITGVPSPISYYPFGPIKSFVHVGGIAFVDDNGQVETVQPIGLDHNVVCPKSMDQADHAYLRLQSGVTGTVRPWLKT